MEGEGRTTENHDGAHMGQGNNHGLCKFNQIFPVILSEAVKFLLIVGLWEGAFLFVFLGVDTLTEHMCRCDDHRVCKSQFKFVF